MSSRQEGTYSVSNPNSPPTPIDLPTYSRCMYQHIKRQMEAVSRSSHLRSKHPNHTPAPMQNNTSSPNEGGSGKPAGGQELS
ncbi:hypothetical protein BGZ61DRAFT_374045 [Ilyonectria robusta]|uniref:uncharacterized protein n=1 Tax=Ilyonectria robusta TaxID=1079257 RepID=UPI001E8ECC63|nr:uncharacterized protein BGZ61DRAFT_374045 [Ilyonectria robusta]KAH8653922.1 hypothetical protein BGZ61DRAFT_374045 [Ilyonectria robusta]